MPLCGWRASCQLPQAEVASQTETRDLADFESPDAQDDSRSESLAKEFQTKRLALRFAGQDKNKVRDMWCFVRGKEITQEPHERSGAPCLSILESCRW